MTNASSRHQIEWTAAGLRRAAAEAGVTVPVDYSQSVAADGLTRSPQLGVTRLGAGIVVHTRPRSDRELPVVVGYADGRGQWYRDGHRHTTASVGTASVVASEEIAL